MHDQAAIELLTQTIRSSAKYRHISDDLVRQMVLREFKPERSSKAVTKAVKNKLHQIGGAFFIGKARYDAWLSILEKATASNQMDELQDACKSIMRHHSSTRERLPILDVMYPEVMSEIQPVQSILDLACGFNPLSLPWMMLETSTIYYACDIYEDLIAFLAEALRVMGVDGRLFTCDLSVETPSMAVDLTLMMKLLPTLTQIDKEVGRRLLASLHSRYILISYPVRSLGGRNKQMVANYERDFYALTEDKTWSIKRFEFSSELVFLIDKQ